MQVLECHGESIDDWHPIGEGGIMRKFHSSNVERRGGEERLTSRRDPFNGRVTV